MINKFTARTVKKKEKNQNNWTKFLNFSDKKSNDSTNK